MRPNGCHLDEDTFNMAADPTPVGEKIAIVKEKSGNVKTGVVVGTYAPFQTCPIACPFHPSKKGGCYANQGSIARPNVAGRLEPNVTRLQPTLEQIADAEVRGLDRTLKKGGQGRAVRLHIKGDAPTVGYAQVLSEAVHRFQERGGGLAWAYTHAWRDVPRAAWGVVSTLASVETETDAHAARTMGYAPARVFPKAVWKALRVETGRHGHLGNAWVFGGVGIRWLACPAQTNEYSKKTKTGTQCMVYDETREHRACKLCMRGNMLHERGYGIAFSAHGPSAQIAKAIRGVELDEGLVAPESLNRARRLRNLADAGAGSVAAAEVGIAQSTDVGEIESLYVGGREHVDGFQG
jgi:hypothetical protein